MKFRISPWRKTDPEESKSADKTVFMVSKVQSVEHVYVAQDMPDGFRDLRLRFLQEGQRTCAALLAARNLNLEAARMAVHSWAGLGSMLGCEQVTERARQVDRVLKLAAAADSGERWLSEATAEMGGLAKLFAELQAAATAANPVQP